MNATPVLFPEARPTWKIEVNPMDIGNGFLSQRSLAVARIGACIPHSCRVDHSTELLACITDDTLGIPFSSAFGAQAVQSVIRPSAGDRTCGSKILISPLNGVP